MNDSPPASSALEKKIQALQKKLERSEDYRSTLEDLRERDQWFHLKLQEEVEAARREMEIEAALERVRARGMAMHRSDDLAGVVARFFEELTGLDFELTRGVIWVFDSETQSGRMWKANPEHPDSPESYLVPYHDHPSYLALLDAWHAREPAWVYDLHGDLKTTWDDFLFGETELGSLPAEVQAGMRAPDRIVLTLSFTDFGALQAVGLEALSDASIGILRRFARVFDQTYTRFLDLQRAEARARDAEQEAALDRVRGEIASMRTTNDLQRITPLIWRELTTLGVPFFRCGVLIADEEAGKAQTYLTTPDGAPLAAFLLPYETVPTISVAIEHWRRKEAHTDNWSRDEFTKWMGVMVEAGLLERPAQYQGGEAPLESLALLFAPFEQGMLYVGSPEPLAEEAVQAVQALADAFAVAYARYEDFQRLEAKNREVEAAMTELRAAQAQLVQSEKMASLGALTAGIAHEIKNPLNFVNNFAGLSQELVTELEEETDPVERAALLEDLKTNAAKIEAHGRRADAIVRQMMEHARSASGERRPVDLNALVEEYTNLAYHGMRARHPDFNATLNQSFAEDAGEVEIVSQEIGRVLINLLDNAFDAVRARKTSGADGYLPSVTVTTERRDGKVEIRVADNGLGMPEAVRAKVFEPFFTTKPTGQGTGLGLSMSYDIVTQGHGGTLTVESEEGRGATFTLALPA